MRACHSSCPLRSHTPCYLEPKSLFSSIVRVKKRRLVSEVRGLNYPTCLAVVMNGAFVKDGSCFRHVQRGERQFRSFSQPSTNYLLLACHPRLFALVPHHAGFRLFRRIVRFLAAPRESQSTRTGSTNNILGNHNSTCPIRTQLV